MLHQCPVPWCRGANETALPPADAVETLNNAVNNATAPLAQRQTVYEHMLSLSATPITSAKKIKDLRAAVYRAFVSIFGKNEARLNSAYQKREKLPRNRVGALVLTYEVGKLAQLKAVFERFV